MLLAQNTIWVWPQSVVLH